MASMKIEIGEEKYSPGTVVQILDEWNEGDRSYYVVASTVEGTDRVDIIPTVWDNPIKPRETVRTYMLRVIAHCDEEYNLELVSPTIRGSQCPMARKRSRTSG